MLIVITTAITYTSYSLNQVTQLAETIGVQQEIKTDKINESFDVVSVRTDLSQFNMTVKNTGDVPVHLTRLWIENTTDASWNIKKYDIDFALAPGDSVKNIGQDIGLTALDSQSYHAQIVSERGNKKEMFLNTVGDSSLYTRVSATPAVMPTGFSTTVTLEVINTGTTQLLNLQPEMQIPTTPTCQACVAPVLEGGPSPASFDSLAPGDVALFEWVYSYSGENGDDVLFEAGILNDARTDTVLVLLQTVETSLNADIAVESGGIGDQDILGNHVLIFHQELTGSDYQMYSGAVDGDNNGDIIVLDSETPHFMTRNQTITNRMDAGNWELALMLKSDPVGTDVNTSYDMIFHFEDGDDTDPDNSEGQPARDLTGCGIEIETDFVYSENQDAQEGVHDADDVHTSDDEINMGYASRPQIAGLLFDNIAIDPDEPIRSAYVTLQSTGSFSGFTNLRIYGELPADGDADNFGSGDGDLSDRDLTTAYVDWTPGTWSGSGLYSTPDISSIIEEITDSSTPWANDNELVILIYDHPDVPSTDRREFEARDEYDDPPPSISITYGSSALLPDWEDQSGPHNSGSYLFAGGECFKSSLEVDPNDDNDIQDNDSTTTLWFKTNGFDNTEQYFVDWDDSPDFYRIGLTSSADVFFEFASGAGEETHCETDGTITYDDDEWYHVSARKDGADDRCELTIFDTTGTEIDSDGDDPSYSSSSVDIDSGRWHVGSNVAEDDKFFIGWIDDIMHWDDVYLSDGDMADLARTDYGEAAYSFIVQVEVTDKNGVYLRDVYDSVTPINATFADPKGGGSNDDYGYTQINMTMVIPAEVNLAVQERLDVNFAWQSPTGTWEALDVDMKIDDSDIADNVGGTLYPSFMQITPPDQPFPTYFEHSPEEEFVLYVVNTGNDGIFLTYQGSRVSFNGTDGSFAGLIHSVNGTGGDDTDYWNLNEDRDSLYIPQGERGRLYFHEATDIPSTDESGNLMTDGLYDVTVWLNGYSDQGETFLRSVYVGTVDVVTP